MTDRTAWITSAACRGDDPEIWFKDKHQAEARRICQGCIVQSQCLSAELDAEGGKPAENRYGIRGGLSPDERAKLHRTRSRKELIARLKAVAA